jgi:hypothetical protein
VTMSATAEYAAMRISAGSLRSAVSGASLT